MDKIEGTKTQKNLQDAFAGESAARNKYTYFASVARKAGYNQIANFFAETAGNEKEHAELWFKELGLLGETTENLEAAAAGEMYENTQMYPTMAKEAHEEGFTRIAKLFEGVTKIEKTHEDRYRALKANIEQDKVFEKDKDIQWICSNCGHQYFGSNAPKKCPVCDHPKAYFEMYVRAY
ncbi:MAG: rubrerythrin family protein [Clostridia bacterium]|jgi:rubrerythrin|nr:rubrerythrin family protein [Clostridia bacterium]MBT7122988.1 rubrerythrin family protein [Clostridia bacterium]